MKKFIKTGTALMAASLLLSGCGGMPELTESQEAMIVSYSAGILAKRNRFQPEGLTAVFFPEEDETEEPKDPEEADTKAPEEPEEPVQQDEGAAGEPEEDVQQAEEPEGPAEPEDGAQAGAVSMEEALGISGMGISYNGFSVNSHYQEGDYFSLDASAGNTYVILNFNITNQTAEPALCDILSKQPIFTLGIEDGQGFGNEVTVLGNDLSTYSAEVGPGGTETAILLFEVPEEAAQSISSISLRVDVDGNGNYIALE